MEVNTEFISVIFVTSGTRGDRLLFKYPFEVDNQGAVTSQSMSSSTEDDLNLTVNCTVDY